MSFHLIQPTQIGRFFTYPKSTTGYETVYKYWLASYSKDAFSYPYRQPHDAKVAMLACAEGCLERMLIPFVAYQQIRDLSQLKTVDIGKWVDLNGYLSSPVTRSQIQDLTSRPIGYHDLLGSICDATLRGFFSQNECVVSGGQSGEEINILGWSVEDLSAEHEPALAEEYYGYLNTADKTTSTLQWWVERGYTPWGLGHNQDMSPFDKAMNEYLQSFGVESILIEPEEHDFSKYAQGSVQMAVENDKSGASYWDVQVVTEGIQDGGMAFRKCDIPYAVVQSMLAAMRYTIFQFNCYLWFLNTRTTRTTVWQYFWNVETMEMDCIQLEEPEETKVEERQGGVYGCHGNDLYGYMLVIRCRLVLKGDGGWAKTNADAEEPIAGELMDLTQVLDQENGTLTTFDFCSNPGDDAVIEGAPVYPNQVVVDAGYFESHTLHIVEIFENPDTHQKKIWIDKTASYSPDFKDAIKDHVKKAKDQSGIDHFELPPENELVQDKLQYLFEEYIADASLLYAYNVNKIDPSDEDSQIMPSQLYIHNNYYNVSEGGEDPGDWTCDFEIVVDPQLDENCCFAHPVGWIEETNREWTMSGDRMIIGTTKWNWSAMPVAEDA